jgi:hypothetical protein
MFLSAQTWATIDSQHHINVVLCERCLRHIRDELKTALKKKKPWIGS